MSRGNPPFIARWLLDRFVGENVSDLVEEYRVGRSSFWYWKRVLSTSFHSALIDIRSHWILALRALFVGLVCLTVSVYCILRPFRVTYEDALWKIDPYLFAKSGRGIFFILRELVPGVLVPCLIFVIVAWIVARLHRPHRLAFTLMNAAVVLLVGSSEVVDGFQHFAKIRHGSYYLVWGATVVFLLVLSILIGGLWERPSRIPAGSSSFTTTRMTTRGTA